MGHKEVNLVFSILGIVVVLALCLLLAGCQTGYQPPGSDLWLAVS